MSGAVALMQKPHCVLIGGDSRHHNLETLYDFENQSVTPSRNLNIVLYPFEVEGGFTSDLC